tara:strand:+ start:160 stop:1443 length:1284 start_codon:yes stop_codon:yes gene_type:complete
MRIGLVGKPNVGKSTFFSAATLAKVDIANYPFCTIEPNVGVAFIAARKPCPCKELREKLESDGRLEPISPDDERKGSICQPRTGSCIGFRRLVPCFLVDVAGLVPGASEGRGRGNAFLADLANCDALIQVVDASASTDIEGNPQDAAKTPEAAKSSMEQEISFLSDELDAWIYGILNDGWIRGVRRVQAEGEKGMISFLHDRFTGLGSSLQSINLAFESFKKINKETSPPWDWSPSTLKGLALEIRKSLFPIHIAANKADIAPQGVDFTFQTNGRVIPCMADMELALRRAESAGLIHYISGQQTFEVPNSENLSEAQNGALQHMQERLTQNNNTGVSTIIDTVLFEELDHIVVYPVQDENQWTDSEGKVLPDAFVVPNNIQAKNLAYKVHSDLGDGFIRGTDGRSRRTVGSEHELADGDVLKIHAKT